MYCCLLLIVCCFICALLVIVFFFLFFFVLLCVVLFAGFVYLVYIGVVRCALCLARRALVVTVVCCVLHMCCLLCVVRCCSGRFCCFVVCVCCCVLFVVAVLCLYGVVFGVWCVRRVLCAVVGLWRMLLDASTVDVYCLLCVVKYVLLTVVVCCALWGPLRALLLVVCVVGCFGVCCPQFVVRCVLFLAWLHVVMCCLVRVLFCFVIRYRSILPLVLLVCLVR